MRTFLVSILLLLMLGCSRQKPATDKPLPPVQKTNSAASLTPPLEAPDKVDPKILMIAAFGEQYRSKSNDAIVDLLDPENRENRNSYLVAPVAVKVIKNGEAVLVLNGQNVDDDGNATSAHSEGGLLSVFFFQYKNGHWMELRRQENIESLGSSGYIGTVEWTMLAPDKPGMVILNGGTWQGYTVSNMSIFDLSAFQLQDLAGEMIKIHSDSNGACEPSSNNCWDVSGEWKFDENEHTKPYGDLLITFTGKKKSPSDKSKTNQGKTGKEDDARVHETARYDFDGTGYKLVEGINPVPDV